jgi:hypothetical protein
LSKQECQEIREMHHCCFVIFTQSPLIYGLSQIVLEIGRWGHCLRPFSGYVEAPESTQGRTRKGATGKMVTQVPAAKRQGPRSLGLK